MGSDTEFTPLVPVADAGGADAYGSVDKIAENVDDASSFPTISSALKPMMKMTLPLAGAWVCSTVLPFISLIFIGHYNKQGDETDEIAAAGLAVMICNGACVVAVDATVCLQSARVCPNQHLNHMERAVYCCSHGQ